MKHDRILCAFLSPATEKQVSFPSASFQLLGERHVGRFIRGGALLKRALVYTAQDHS